LREAQFELAEVAFRERTARLLGLVKDLLAQIQGAVRDRKVVAPLTVIFEIVV